VPTNTIESRPDVCAGPEYRDVTIIPGALLLDALRPDYQSAKREQTAKSRAASPTGSKKRVSRHPISLKY